MISMYILAVFIILVFHMWFAKEFTNATLENLLKRDIPFFVTLAVIVALFIF